MAGKDVSYQFFDALAKSIGTDTETVKQVLAKINQLQTQTQALELAAQDKVPTNHASQQPIFGTANKQMYGHVKIAHEVTNDSSDGVALSPDAVYAYAPDRKTTPRGISPTIRVRTEPTDWATSLQAFATGNFVGVSGTFQGRPSLGPRKIILSNTPPFSKLGVASVCSDGYWAVSAEGDTITLKSNELGATSGTTTFMAIIPFIPNNA